jgi:hypothetical protein
MTFCRDAESSEFLIVTELVLRECLMRYRHSPIKKKYLGMKTLTKSIKNMLGYG